MQTYLHSVDLDSWYVCWNLSLNGIILSAKEFLRNNPQLKSFGDSRSPISSEITVTPTPTGVSVANNENKKRNVEIDFEKIRKQRFSNLPSRLNSLWIAENTDGGKTLLHNMFGNDANRKDMIVTLLPNSNIHRADKRWYEEYYTNKDTNFILNYWKGVPYDKKPRWEFLIDGGFKIGKEDVLFLREHVKQNFHHRLGMQFIDKSYELNKVI